jgi:hypothetical protein
MFVSEPEGNPMRPNFTLPELQTRLDRLSQGAILGISNRDFERLFGKTTSRRPAFSALPKDMIASSAEARARSILESGSSSHTNIPNEGRRVRLALY